MNTQILPVTDGSIAYDVQGSGPLVICVPGLGDLRQEYRFLAPRLVQAGFRVASLDVRGHGESGVAGWSDFSVSGVGRDILALIQHLDAGPAILIGTSMGAGAAVWAAAEAPQAVRGLALIGPSVHGELTPANNLLYSLLFARPWGPTVWQKYYTSLYPTRKPEDLDTYTARLRANLSERGRMEVMMNMIRASKRASEERLGQVSAPALVLMGSKDPDFKDPEAEARWIAAAMRSALVHIMPGAGHYPHAEFPAESTAVLQSFFATLE